MNLGKTPYNIYEKFVLRSPSLPYSQLAALLREMETDIKVLDKVFENKMMQEAIYTASPSLFDKMTHLIEGTVTKEKEIKKIRLSLLRYLLRMYTRCTPFGLFAGWNVGTLTMETELKLKSYATFRRKSRIDTTIINFLSESLSHQKYIKEQSTYFTNQTVFRVVDKLRYIGYSFGRGNRSYTISSVENNEYLQLILNAAKDGLTFQEMVAVFQQYDESLDEEDINEFLSELIESKLLLSHLGITVIGREPLDKLLSDLLKMENVEELCAPLQKVKLMLQEALDAQPIGSTLEVYDQLGEVLAYFTDLKYEKKFLLQTELLKKAERCTLHKKIRKDLARGIVFLNRISKVPPMPLMERFKENFYRRYESREMPLAFVLDSEIGIGYAASSKEKGISPLIAGLSPDGQGDGAENRVSPIEHILFQKYSECLEKGEMEIELTEEDIQGFPAPSWEKMPNSFSYMCELDSNNLIYLKAFSGPGAGKLLGRFSMIDEAVYDYIAAVNAKEEEAQSDTIFAEIVYVPPEARAVNILLRPTLRKYEIPYLTQSSVAQANQIKLSELYVGVDRGTVYLRHPRINKKIIPTLGTAHNYARNSLPLYHFLCDLGLQHKQPSLQFSWRRMSSNMIFFPRVRYRNIVLSKARWKCSKTHLKSLLENGQATEATMEAVEQWRLRNKIPPKVVLSENDNKLFVDLEKALCFEMLISAIKGRDIFLLEEFVFKDKELLVESPEGSFTNEFIFSFYKNISQNQ